VKTGDRRVGKERIAPIVDSAIEPFEALIHSVKYGTYGKQLERAAHEKPLARSMNEAPTGLEIMREDTEPTARMTLELRKRVVD
jgi:hypothetical protein